MAYRLAPPVDVYLDGKIEPLASVLEVVQSTGSQPDSATFVIERPGSHPKLFLEAVSLVDSFANRTCEIVIGGTKVIHFGRVSGGDVEIEGDLVRFTSRFDDHLFGDPLVSRTEVIYPAPAGATLPITDVDGDHVFNALVEGRPLPNMWVNGGGKFNFLIDYDSLPRTVFDPISPGPNIPNLAWWTLTDIVLYLCNRLNPETYVANPTYAELIPVLGESVRSRGGGRPVVTPLTSIVVTDFRLPIGRLPDLLDQVLEPFGYNWRVEYVRRGYRKIAIGHRAGGRTPLVLPLQSSGQTLNLDLSRVRNARLSVDHVHRSTNQVVCLGAFAETEGTFELVPAWEPAYDELFGKDLQLDSDAVQANPKLARVWRDWVLNEGGDYVGLRTGTMPYADQIRVPFDVAALFGHAHYARCRRRFYPMITQLDNMTPFGTWDGALVEWWDGNYWRPAGELKNQSIQLLTHECGVRFSNPTGPPDELIALGLSVAKVRITATIRSDIRIRGIFGPLGSALADTRQQVIDLGDQYRYRTLNSSSVFYSEVAAGTMRATVRDDRDALQDLAVQLYDAWNRSTIGGEVDMEGIDYDLEWFGKALTGIQPRGIDLRTTSRLIRTPQYVSVVAVKWDVQRQATTLRIDTPRESRLV